MTGISSALFGLWFLATIFFGGVAPQYARVHVFCAALIGVVAVWRGFWKPASGFEKRGTERAAAYGLTLVILFGAFQLLPLPEGVLRSAAPLSWDLSFGTLRSLQIAPEKSGYPISLASDQTRQSLSFLLAFVLLLFAAVQCFAKAEGRRRAALALCVFGSAVAFFGMIHRFSGSTKMFWIWEHGWTFFGPYVNTNHAGALFAVCGVMTLALMSRPMPISNRTTYVLLFGVTVLALLFTGSRGAVLALGVALIVDRLTQRRHSRGDHRWMMATLVGIVAVAVYWKASFFAKLFATPESISAGTEFRPRIWMYALRLFLRNPFAGTGLGTFDQASPLEVRDSLWLHPEHAENDYLEFLSTAGLVGTALVLPLVWILSRRVWSVLTDRDPSVTRRAFALGVVALAVNSFFVFNAPLPSHQILWAILLGGVLASERRPLLQTRGVRSMAVAMAGFTLLLGLWQTWTWKSPSADDEALWNVPLTSDSAINRSATQLLLGEELQNITKTLQRDPRDAEALYTYAYAKAGLGERGVALKAAQLAAQLDPFNLQARSRVAQAVRDPDYLLALIRGPGPLTSDQRTDLALHGALFARQSGNASASTVFVDELESLAPEDWRVLALLSTEASDPLPLLIRSWKASRAKNVATREWDRTVLAFFSAERHELPTAPLLALTCAERADVATTLRYYSAWKGEPTAFCRLDPEDLSKVLKPNTPVTDANVSWLSERSFETKASRSQVELDVLALPVALDAAETPFEIRMEVRASRPLKEQIAVQVDNRWVLTREAPVRKPDGTTQLRFFSRQLSETSPGPHHITAIGFTPLERDGRFTIGPIEVFVDSTGRVP